MNETYHLKLNPELIENSKIAILPGDPGRVATIAAAVSAKYHPLATNREYTSYLALRYGRPILICSTGIGGPSTSICVEELATLGVRTFIRVGTTGAIQERIALGDLIITTGSVRLDGASSHYAPPCYPAVADYSVLFALVEAAKKLSLPHHIGITASSDTFYPGQERKGTFSGYIIREFKDSLEEWRRLHVLNYEMESATLLTMCSTFGLQAGCVSGVVAKRDGHEHIVGDVVKKAEQDAISIAVEAISSLSGIP